VRYLEKLTPHSLHVKVGPLVANFKTTIFFYRKTLGIYLVFCDELTEIF
jgi:hypothetical protein